MSVGSSRSVSILDRGCQDQLGAQGAHRQSVLADFRSLGRPLAFSSCGSRARFRSMVAQQVVSASG
jgi:hypothetical protein